MKRFMKAGPHPAVGIPVMTLCGIGGILELSDKGHFTLFGKVIQSHDAAVFAVIASAGYLLLELVLLARRH